MDDADLSNILTFLQGVQDQLANPRPLAEDAREILIADNKVARVAGLDAYDAPLAPVKARTPGEIRRRGGDGPRLAPRGAGSRVVSGFQVTIQSGSGSALVVGSWPGAPFLRFHSEALGLRREASEAIDQAVDRFARRVLGDNSI